jgi:hypothetical protein
MIAWRSGLEMAPMLTAEGSHETARVINIEKSPVGAPRTRRWGLTARRGRANPATVPLMHSLRCSIIKANGCRTTSDRSSAGFLI